ncbi:cytochrome P450 [Aspergillus tanneri]|uniref:Cytochrome P450 n=2 Tax=Aspergillus tanneri TaxID=1220188 RepID=A0A5M9N5R2_9EURO|nr:uncharacterized protein ATNIH1004_001823 [Aspergillus tanneri]KAA8652914.1 hypothetical protein ATNIH1004_001823 [Aspergillus tanneri]
MGLSSQLSWGVQSLAPQHSGPALLLGTFVSLLVWRFLIWFRLRHIPGPFLASLTNFTRMSWVSTKKAHLIHQEIHQKYGDVVRLGPNMVSISDPSAILTIYPMRKGFVKNDFYVPLRPYTKKGGALPNVFTALDEDLHMKLRYPVASFFSLSNVSKFEGLVDEVLQVIDEQLERRFSSHGEIFDLTEWLQFFAFDVMGTMTFSKRYGFLEQGKDVGGMLDAIAHFMRQAAPMMQIPWLDKVLYKNHLADTLRPTPGTNIMKFVGATIQERQKLANENGDFTKAGKGDFLDRYISTQKNDANIPPWFVTAWTISNVLAGSDSVGTVMKTTMYNLLKSPQTLEKLRTELVAANVSRPYPRWSEVNNLPYLDACIQEALRVHPPFAMPFERIVPEGGIHIAGQYIPAGTIVGASPYVINRHKPTYGADAELWRPERWLEGDPGMRKKRDDGLLTFGAGRRVCLGKHIGIFEVKKLVPFLVLNYDISMVKPEAFAVENQWFFRQTNLHAQIRKIPLETVRSRA